MHVSNLKSAALTVLELLAFNPQNLGVTWPWPCPLFEKFFRGHVRGLSLGVGTCMSNLKTSFNRFKVVWLAGPLRTDRQTDRQNHIEQKQHLRDSLRSLGGVNQWNVSDREILILFYRVWKTECSAWAHRLYVTFCTVKTTSEALPCQRWSTGRLRTWLAIVYGGQGHREWMWLR